MGKSFGSFIVLVNGVMTFSSDSGGSAAQYRIQDPAAQITLLPSTSTSPSLLTQQPLPMSEIRIAARLGSSLTQSSSWISNSNVW